MMLQYILHIKTSLLERIIINNKLTFFTNYLHLPGHLHPAPSCYPKVFWTHSNLLEVRHDLGCLHQSLYDEVHL